MNLKVRHVASDLCPLTRTKLWPRLWEKCIILWKPRSLDEFANNKPQGQVRPLCQTGRNQLAAKSPLSKYAWRFSGPSFRYRNLHDIQTTEPSKSIVWGSQKKRRVTQETLSLIVHEEKERVISSSTPERSSFLTQFSQIFKESPVS